MLDGRFRTRDSDLLALVPRDVTESEFMDIGGSIWFVLTSIGVVFGSEGVAGRDTGASIDE